MSATSSHTLSGSAIGTDARAAFIVRTYNHLFGAIVGFTLLEVVYFKSGVAEKIAGALMSVSWLLVLGAYMIVSWFASRVAHRAKDLGTQYLALVGFVVVKSIIFVPLLYTAERYASGAIESAAALALAGFAGLTGIAFWTRKDFSFMRSFLAWCFLIALVGIVASLVFGFHLGTWFSVAMIALAGAAILYDTSNVIHHFPRSRYVGAALELFASVALMFWYVLRLRD